MSSGAGIIGPFAVVLALATLLHTVPAAAELSADEVRQRIAAEYGVRVLKVRRDTLNGTAVFLVTVMNPGGNFNAAFQVNTLAVDAETGNLLPAFRHLPSGQRESEARTHEPNRQPADTLRRGFPWR